MAWRRNFGTRTTLATTAAIFIGAFVGCIERPIAAVAPRTQSGITEEIKNEGVDKVDLLMMVDNSNSMRDNQANIAAQFATLIETLTDPKCTSDTDSTPHECDPANPNDVPQYPAVKDLRVGVVSSDLGTPGTTISGCAESDFGDDGLLNPIHFGPAIQHHLPWTMPSASSCPGVSIAPPGFRPDDCQDPAQFPAWIGFTSADATQATRDQFTHDFRCNAALYVCGCGLESQIEAVYRALIWHGAGPVHVPNGDTANEGFLRDDALLAIVMLTDEEDGSVENCNYAVPGEDCVDHTDVYRTGTPTWASDNPNLRFYLYQPGGAQDPNWPIDRYYNVNDPTKGLLALKPNHPERIVFAAITGVPLAIPHRTVNGMDRIDWDALLGPQGPNGPNDFYGRDLTMAVSGTQAGANGPYTMATGLVSGCTDLLSAACYREDQTYDPAQPCSTGIYRGVPSRRVVELARRFDETPLCGGSACNNGLVESICASDYSNAMRNIIQKIQSRIQVPCLPRVLDTQQNSEGNIIVQCLVREIEPDNTTVCSALPGRIDAVDATTMEPVTYTDPQGNAHKVCDIQQVATYPAGSAMPGYPVAGGTGWYYDITPQAGAAASCAQRISFTPGAAPSGGTQTRLECIQSIRGVDAGAGGG